MPESVFIEMTRKSKFDLPPARISPSDIVARVLRQTRTSMDLMINPEFLGTLCVRRFESVVTVSNAPLAVNETWFQPAH